MLWEGIAWAADAGAGGQATLVDQLLYGPAVPFALLIVAFYWFFIRPQTKKAAEHRDMLAKLKRNDEVVTSGGMLGRIHEIGDRIVTLEIAPNVRVRVERAQIAALSNYGKTPSAGKREKAE
ncbi:MAG TPA: preprotein translocase subunit YajC [Candidatus Binataceae bacterium]|jgi:preprotein translocase subunit YajC|nr:preprotein translocase subunit YajC [Candidatus Binataceae bacterium]